MVKPEVKVLADGAAVAREAASVWAQAAEEAAAERGVFRAALSGGKTPKALFFILAGKDYAKLPWDKTEFYWGDERYVPPRHDESNFRAADDLLLSRLEIPPARVHPIPTSGADPSRDAQRYEATLRAEIPDLAEGFPRFDLVLMGLGLDGHTASLFPGSAAARERERWAVAARAANLTPPERITLTAPVFNQARHALFLACGKAKAEVVREVLKGDGSPRPEDLPARLISPRAGKLTFLLDKSAAELL